jgi:hypothetical protein
LHRSGIAFFGDIEDFASNGRKRIGKIEKVEDGLRVTVNFAAGENTVRVYGYANAKPRVKARIGNIRSEDFDAVSGRYTLELGPSPEDLTESPGGETIRRAVVAIGPAERGASG